MPDKNRLAKPSVKLLQRFTPLDEAPPEQLAEVARQAEWRQAGKHTVLMDLGDTDEHSIFLIKGNILLEAADGRKHIIKHTDPAAHSPLSRLRPSRFRITALTPVQYLRIDNALLDKLLQEEEASEMISSHYYVVEEGPESGSELNFASQVLSQIYEDLHQDRLLIFSWQPACLPITARILNERKKRGKLAKVAMLDPALALKLLRGARKHDKQELPDQLDTAVRTLGLEATHRLAFLNLFRESCRPHTQFLNEAFRSTWEQAIIVSRLAAELSKEQNLIPAETAALVGLLHNIGKLTLISYAYNFYREVSLEELRSCVQMFSREAGRMVLSSWNLPSHLVHAISDSFKWSRQIGGNEVTLGDILVAARLYTRLARKNKPLKSSPALTKLGLEDPDSRQGRMLRDLVTQSMAEARQLLKKDHEPKNRDQEPHPTGTP